MNGPPVEFALWIEVEAVDHQGDGETQDLDFARTATFKGGYGSEGEKAAHAAAHALAALIGTARELAEGCLNDVFTDARECRDQVGKLEGLAGAVMRQTACLKDGGDT